MEQDNLKPTLGARLKATAQLLDREAGRLPGYVPERDRDAMLAALESGWRDVMRIKARAAINAILAERARQRP